MRSVELRCPEGPRRLLSKVLVSGDKPTITDDNLVELTCPDCKRILRQNGQQVFRVLHRFNLWGDLVQSVVQD